MEALRCFDGQNEEGKTKMLEERVGGWGEKIKSKKREQTKTKNIDEVRTRGED